MNKEEILNKYIDLIDKGYCSDCNELNCIDNFPHAKITHAIRELQQENQELKLELSGYRQAILEDKDMLGLKEKNQELKKQLEELEKENFNLRENIYIERISFPSEGRNFKELIEMPTYEELQQENKKYKEVIDKLNFIKNRKNQGASQENINKMAIKFVNSYLKEVSE